MKTKNVFDLYRKATLFMGLMLGFVLFTTAQSIIVSSAGSGINSVTLDIQDPHWTGVPAGHVYQNQNPTVDAILEFTDGKNNFYPYNWKAEIRYTAYLFTSTTTFSTVPNEYLTVNYDRNNPYQDIDIKTYTGYKRVGIVVNAVTYTVNSPGGPVVTTAIPANTSLLDYTDLTLTLKYTPDKVYSPTTAANTPYNFTHSFAPDKNFCHHGTSGFTTLTLNEQGVAGYPQLEAQSYDIEWVFIDIPEANFDLKYPVDWRNAIRVNVTAPSANIPLAYPRGKIVYRSRVISKEWDGTRFYRYEGPWSWGSSGNIVDTVVSTDKNYFNYCGLEPQKNWSYSASYAENAIRTEQLGFFDATGRNRRTVGFNYQENKAIISKTYYDKQGRAAIQALPVPINNNGNSFYPGYADSFNNSNFDTPSVWAADSNLGMPATQPVAQYYSSSNPLAATVDYAYIPDAEKYPFVQTKFVNDGSGRAEAVSAPGAAHKIGRKHDTRFKYGTVEGQQVLDRLFGNEVGFSEHYKKNYTTDANGVTSVSYVDGSGRVVASALAGNTPQNNLVTLTHNSSPVTVDLLDNVSTNSDGAVTTVKELVVPFDGEYTFNYDLQGISHTLPCFGARECRYNVIFKVTNENGNAVALFKVSDGSAFNGQLLNITSQTNIAFKAALTTGKYIVTKTTSLSTATDAYVDELETYVRNAGFGPNNPCLPQPAPVLECLTCAQKCERVYKYTLTYNGVTDTVWIAANGTLYTANSTLAAGFAPDVQLDAGGTQIQAIKNLIAACKAACGGTPVLQMSPCDMMRQTLVMDVSPGGQYFDNHPATLGNPAATQADKDKWLTLFIPTVIKNNLLTLAGIPAGSWEDLRSRWTDDMAMMLLPFHPEYCHYNYFCNVVANKTDSCCKVEGGITPPSNTYANSGAYDMAMQASHTDAHAFAGGFFNPLALGSVPSAYLGLCQNRDPYFCNDPGATNLMSDFLNKYIANPWVPGTFFSIWDVIDNKAATYPADPSNDEKVALKQFMQTLADQFSAPGGSFTKFIFFRGYYQGRKQQIIQNAFPAWADENCNFCANFAASGCTVPCTGSCASCWLSGKDNDNDGIVDNGQTVTGCVTATPFSITNFNIRYPYINALNAEDVPQTDLCETYCRAYALNWINQLTDPWLGCQFSGAGFTQTMRDALYNSFYNYCNGSCSAVPNIGQVPDFSSTSPLYTGLMNIVTTFEANAGVDFCPNLNTDAIVPGFPTPPASKLSCQCGNLAQMITAAENGLVNASLYPNPLLYNRYGQPVTGVVNLSNAATFINLMLPSLGTGMPTVTGTDIQKWLGVCSANVVDSVNAGLGVGDVKFPAVFNCGTGGEGPITCENLNAGLNQMLSHTLFEQGIQQLRSIYKTDLRSTCLSGLPQREHFTLTFALDEYQYTLYYYDRAGNLVKTVPPEGVQVLGNSDVTAAGTHRNANYTSATYAYNSNGTLNTAFKRPDHRLTTNYKYNSLEQLVEKTTPDEGKTKFWYDAVGRLVLSQNAKQAVGNKYSYTLYDSFGRMYETGQLTTNGAAFTEKNTADPVWLANFHSTNTGSREQVTYTRYDVAQTGTNLPVQNNLRNRVASSYYFEAVPNAGLSNYIHATHYSYDAHGNVAQSIQDFPFLNQFGMRFASTEYEYELVSGNVKKVSYRKAQVDQFYHRYSYDKNNSLITVETSRDGKIWDVDAEYFYYTHGPLQRVETGDKKVQGTDYTYTINGWKKAVNGTRLDPTSDMGADGRHVLIPGSNNLAARDAFGYSLTYYYGDYKRIGAAQPAFEPADMFNAGVAMGAAILGNNGSRGQYNGNIAASTTVLRDHCDARTSELGMVYTYDHLYRLLQSRGFERTTGAAFAWNGVAATTKWATDYTYDANGNIKTLQRKDQAGTLIDNLTYAYESSGGRLVSNKLYNVNDAITGSTLPEDYEVLNGTFNPANAPGTGHFKYDEIGNLKSDISAGEKIGTIEWNVYGKLKKITRDNGSTKANIEFYYDAAGRRIAKIVKPSAGSAVESLWKYTIFSYDAGGKLMAEYEIEYTGTGYRLNNTGGYIYGANKAGKTRQKLSLRPVQISSYLQIQACSTCATAGIIPSLKGGADTTTIKPYNRTLGNKQYEFGNHLGNVLVTVSDRKLAVDDGIYTYSAGTLTKASGTSDGRLDYYLPDVLTSTDYYPGGMPLPGRIFEGGAATNTTSAPATSYAYGQITFATAGVNGYASIPGGGAVTLANPGGATGKLTVTKNSTAAGIWGVRSGSFTLYQGIPYNLSFALTLGSCSGRIATGWRIVDASGTVVASGPIISGGTISANFIIPGTASGSYYIEVYRDAGTTGCIFDIDNVQVTYTTYTNTSVCGTVSSANQYAWGHNGQLKDNEIYGSGNAYSAEYWEYDARLLRRWNTDPITYDWQSTYACFNNNPIYFADPLGLEGSNDPPGGEKDKDGKSKDSREAASGLADAPGTAYSGDGNTRSLGEYQQHFDSKCNCYLGSVSPSPPPSSKVAASSTKLVKSVNNIIDGFIGGLKATLDGLKHQLTPRGYLETVYTTLNPSHLAVQVGGGLYNVANNVPSYTRDDYEYALGFALEKAVEIAILRKAGKLSQKPAVNVVTSTAETELGAISSAEAVVMEPVAAEGGAKTFFERAKYSDKVLRQMGKADDIHHAFPKSVDGFAAKFGKWTTQVGLDGKTYQWLKMPGSYRGKIGTFEYIKDANGVINHRFFNVTH